MPATTATIPRNTPKPATEGSAPSAPRGEKPPRADHEQAHSSERRSRRRRGGDEQQSSWRPALQKLDDAEQRVAKILAKAATTLPPDTARSIVLEVLIKSLETAFTERIVWDAVLVREQQKIAELNKLRDSAS